MNEQRIDLFQVNFRMHRYTHAQCTGLNAEYLVFNAQVMKICLRWLLSIISYLLFNEKKISCHTINIRNVSLWWCIKTLQKPTNSKTHWNKNFIDKTTKKRFHHIFFHFSFSSTSGFGWCVCVDYCVDECVFRYLLLLCS